MLHQLKTRYHLLRGAFISRFRRYILGAHVHSLLINSQNGFLAVDPEDTSVGLDLARDGVFAQSTLEVLLPLITEQSHVMVAGAHVGSLAIPLSRKAARVVAFEANPNTYRLLELNKKLNASDPLEIYHLALGSSEGTLTFLLNKVNSGGSKRVPKISHVSYYSDNPEVVTVPMNAADNVLPGASFDLMVMDIEGSEYDALKGMTDILSRTQHLFIEYLPHHLDLVAGVTDQQFVELLSPHFRTAKYHQGDVEGKTPHLLEFFTTIRSMGGGDVLLSK